MKKIKKVLIVYIYMLIFSILLGFLWLYDVYSADVNLLRGPLGNTTVRQKEAQKRLSADLVVANVLPASDGSAKIVQFSSSDPSNITFETGYYPIGEEDHICISSQIGCNMGCIFCLSTAPFEYKPGRKTRMLRNLSTDEIVTQVENVLKTIPSHRAKLVFSFMGMGEPFNNIDNVKKAIRILGKTYPNSRVLISTVGYDIEGIHKFADEVGNGKFSIEVKLQISLHASDDKKKIKTYAKVKAYI